ncbi:acyl-CoA reductase-like NAD-dependent aldehyde dehydrogenase [Rhodococcus sp. AG1013]|uniref:aldehyde dehydrogenase family protein n=1 Tax=Rhodococcus sp. AG1013 TaxID=2183996 RepID=UPI000E0A7312|nr:aldehyde dehydrogenase family protein [Rhodococcus sp. AG1013]RDI16936.1 acyl-CoA reductase-like NAD-dependent aldehyde dehydrogenase [Rhodococcus sp. AG1013]
MTTSWIRDAVLIDNEWRRCPTVSDVYNPATEEVVGSAATASIADVDAAVRSARNAGKDWGRTDTGTRADLLDALHAQLVSGRDRLVAATVAEVGAPVTVAEASHVDLAIEIIASFADIARRMPAHDTIGNSTILRRPAGVVGCITPWNYPLYQLAAKVGAALAAGCTTVVKPAELTPLSTYLFCDALLEAGMPSGVVNLVPGRGSVVGAAIVEHPGVDVVSFTGSTTVGRQVGRVAGEQLKRACLELGGKSASVVLDDADLSSAVVGSVEAAMLNSGQTCSAWTRLLVPRQRYAEAVEMAAAHSEAMTVGDPLDRNTQLGPVISGQQRAAIADSVERALARGARLAAGGTQTISDRGHYLRPTVLADVDRADPVAREEIFGPVLVVLPHDGDDDAIETANDSEYGLAGAVWSADRDRALAVAGRMDTGQVDVNGADFNPLAPFGGWKNSGLGRELGRVGIDEYTELTAVQL